MTHTVFFSMEITLVVLIWSYLDWHIFYNFQSISFKSYTFYRIIGK